MRALIQPTRRLAETYLNRYAPTFFTANSTAPSYCQSKLSTSQLSIDATNHIIIYTYTHIVHEKQRPFKCDLCDKRFGEKGNQRKHMQSVHMNHRPFQCHLCPSSFAFKDGLARHRRLVHENIRPFRCSRCGAAYKQISQLRRHTDTCGTASSSRRH